jgi:hypothetical protein
MTNTISVFGRREKKDAGTTGSRARSKGTDIVSDERKADTSTRAEQAVVLSDRPHLYSFADETRVEV